MDKTAPERLDQSGFSWSKRWWIRSGIRWTTRKSSAPRSRQITTPAPHHSISTGRMLFSSWRPTNCAKATGKWIGNVLYSQSLGIVLKKP